MIRKSIIVGTIRFILIPVIGSLIQASSLLGQDSTAVSPRRSLNYYLRLRNEEFLQTMIPKERFLLGIIKTVHEEVRHRRAEGIQFSDLGFDEITTPEDVFIDEYEAEVERIVDLLDEISDLERQARRRVNFKVLSALTALKAQVRQILKIDEPTVHDAASLVLGSEIQGAPDTESEPSDSEPSQADDPDDILEDAESLDELYEQWKYNRILDHKVKLTEYLFLRERLLTSGTEDQVFRMFQLDYQRGLVSYSSGDFILSRMQLQDILATYTNYSELDDVLYYAGESSYGCNYFDEAQESYERLVELYPSSTYAAKSLIRLIFIHYIYGELHRLTELYDSLLPRRNDINADTFGAVSYLVAYAQFRAGDYEGALDYLGQIEPGTVHFYPSLYLSAACYSNVGDDELSMSLYQRLIDEENKGDKDFVLAQIKNNALLKLGLIYYERNENDKATSYFDQVNRSFEHYDLSMMGKAWSAYRSGKPGEALRNVEWVLSNSLVSNYMYEARVLAASSKELLGHSEQAIDDLKDVFQTSKEAEEIGKTTSDRAAMIQDIQLAERVRQQAQEGRDREILAALDEIRQFMAGTLAAESDKEGSGDFSVIMNTLREKINILDGLELQASNMGNTRMVSEIRRLRSDLIDTMEDHRSKAATNSLSSEDDPLIQQMGMNDYFKYVFRSLLTQTVREKEQTRDNIRDAGELLAAAQARDDFDLSIQMEIAREEFQDYYGKLNQHEVWIRENFPQEFRVELDKWATFSGYGISNINFSRIKDCERRIGVISQTIDALDRVFGAKRKDLENRIQGLLSDVAKIEEQMLEEASKREQQEKETFYQTEYFNRQRQETVTGRLREQPEIPKKKTEKEKEKE